jgi:hypothetical protein
MFPQRQFSVEAPLKQQAISNVAISKDFDGVPFKGVIQKYDVKYQW